MSIGSVPTKIMCEQVMSTQFASFKKINLIIILNSIVLWVNKRKVIYLLYSKCLYDIHMHILLKILSIIWEGKSKY